MTLLLIPKDPALLRGKFGSRPPIAYKGRAGWTLERPQGHGVWVEALVLQWNGEVSIEGWDRVYRHEGKCLISRILPAKADWPDGALRGYLGSVALLGSVEVL